MFVKLIQTIESIGTVPKTIIRCGCLISIGLLLSTIFIPTLLADSIMQTANSIFAEVTILSLIFDSLTREKE